MAAPARAELRRHLGYVAVAIAIGTLALLLLQVMLGRRLEQGRLRQMGSEVAASVLLGEVALERFSPRTLSQIGDMRLMVGSRPEPAAVLAQPPPDRLLRVQAERLRVDLCRRLPRCPAVWPSHRGPRGVWVEMASPLETVWLFAPLPRLIGWPPDPFLLSLALGAGGLGAVLLFLTLEVQRPLRQLEGALGGVGAGGRSAAAVPARGAAAVRRLTGRFNAMVERLERADRDRTTMLAGIAHDLRSPLTRLRLRLTLAGEDPMPAREREQTEADLQALERITRQFLLFAGAEAGGGEAATAVPLHELLAETAAGHDGMALELDAPPLVRRVRPVALARAVGNLLENALAHGRPPLRMVLREHGPEGFEIQVWDHGDGIPAARWDEALRPFHRLDPARGGQGHSGLGLSIAERVARDHRGELVRLDPPAQETGGAGVGQPCFGVALRGRSLGP